MSAASSDQQLDYHADSVGNYQLSTAGDGTVHACYAHKPSGGLGATTDPVKGVIALDCTGPDLGEYGDKGTFGATLLDWLQGVGNAYAQEFHSIYSAPARWLEGSVTLQHGTPTLGSRNPTLEELACDDPDIAAAYHRVGDAGQAIHQYVNKTINDFTWQAATMAVGGIAEIGGEAFAADPALGEAAAADRNVITVMGNQYDTQGERI